MGVKAALLELAANLLSNVLFEATHEEARNIVSPVVGIIRNGGRLQQIHQAGEALFTAVVGSRTGENERLTRSGEETAQFGAL